MQLAKTLLTAGLISSAFGQEPAAPAVPQSFTVQTGTRIPLGLINSISTKHSAPGDRIYLETVFPIVQNGKIVIPPGSYVQGTVTEVKRPGRVKGRGELYVRFDTLTLPNGVTRDFRGRVGGLDGRASETLDRAEGKIKSDSNVDGDLKTVAETTAAGASIGTIAGAAAGHAGLAGTGHRFRRRSSRRTGRSANDAWPRCGPRQRKHDRNGSRPSFDL